MRKDLRVLADGATLYNLGDRHVYAPYGLRGGQAGRLGATLLNADLRTGKSLHSKGTYRLRANDLISWQTAGAGGVGNPLHRTPAAVLRDVRNGVVSIAGAASDYGVVIDSRRLTVDPAATERLRRRMAAKTKTATGRQAKTKARATASTQAKEKAKTKTATGRKAKEKSKPTGKPTTPRRRVSP